jgi:tRNA nucleotidyltransferase (CCA-adding enzyme)
MRAATLVELLEKCDALRRPARFNELLDSCLCDYTGRAGWEMRSYDSPARMLKVLAAVNSVDAGKIAADCVDRGKIPERIRQARIKAVRQALNEAADEPEQQ